MESSREEDWAKYREIRNQVTRDLRIDRRDHKEKVYRELQEKKDSRGLFRMIKNYGRMEHWRDSRSIPCKIEG